MACSTRPAISSSISICSARRDPVVERLDLGPQQRAARRLRARCDRRARSPSRPVPVRAAHVVDEGDAGAVDEVVGDDRRDDLAPQRVRGDLRREALAQGRREIAAQIVGELRQHRAGRRPAAPRRASSWHRRAAPRAPAGSGRAAPPRAPRASRHRAGIRARGRAGRLRSRSRISRAWRSSADGAARLGDRQRLALQIIVAQHQRGDIVGHLRQAAGRAPGGRARRPRSRCRAGS